EPAGDIRTAACLDDGVETFARCAENRHEHGVRCEAAEHPADLPERADDRDALDPPAAQRGIVVDEADDALTLRLAKRAQQASAAATCTDDHRASLGAA